MALSAVEFDEFPGAGSDLGYCFYSHHATRRFCCFFASLAMLATNRHVGGIESRYGADTVMYKPFRYLLSSASVEILASGFYSKSPASGGNSSISIMPFGATK